MPTVRLLNWNVQTFGPTKAGSKYGNYDIVHAIAKYVVAERVDIFVMLEVNTTSRATAEEVTTIMLDALQEHAAVDGEWRQAVLSPNTGREFYAFFIRDVKFTTPVPLTGPIVPGFGEPAHVLGQMRPIANAQFSVASTNTIGVLERWFPLLAPDQQQLDVLGYSMGYPPWPAIRRPVFGLFKIRGAHAGNEYLPVITCHFAAKETIALEQFNVLPYFSFLSGLAPVAPSRPVMLNIDFVKRQPKWWVLTGDFNVNYSVYDYRVLTGSHKRALGARVANTRNTLLVTYNKYSRTQKTTESLAVKNLDNFLTRTGTTALTPLRTTNPAVSDIPRLIQLRTLKLNASVQHYQELDQRGFLGQPYQQVTRDYANQLTNKTTMINTPGALMGGRLISDHLPTLVTVDVY